MSFQTDVEAISASSVSTATTTVTTTTLATNAFSVDALGDDGGTGSLTLPDSSVINLDGKLVKVTIAGIGNATIKLNGTIISTIENGATHGFAVELIAVWNSSVNAVVWYITNPGSAAAGYFITPISSIATGITSQSDFNFSISGATSVSQFTAKLA